MAGDSSKRASRRESEAAKSRASFSMAPPRIEAFWLLIYVLLIITCVVVMATRPDLRGYAFVGLIVTMALMPVGLRSAEAAVERSGASEAGFDRLAD
ncbi:MAG: hypothetical protein VYC34_00330, partial [Planctomycetota bacterium]|nr:hypothetical protein [Planctomycetota bacterium]